MKLMEIPGNVNYVIDNEKNLIPVNGASEVSVEKDGTVLLDIYETGKRNVNINWLYLVCYYRLKMSNGYENYIHFIEFKPMKRVSNKYSDSHAVLLSVPVYHKEKPNFRMIPRFPNYFVNDDGEIWNESTKNILLSYKPPHREYLMVGITDQAGLFQQRNQLVHRLVGYAWVKNDNFLEKNVIDHIDGNKLNCSHANLRWVSRAENNSYTTEQNLKADNIRVVTKNIVTGEIKEHLSVTKAAEYIGRSRLTIPQTGLIPGIVWAGKNGQFEMLKHGSKMTWTDFTDLDKIKQHLKMRRNMNKTNNTQVKCLGYAATNGKTIYRAKTIEALARVIELAASTVRKYMLRKKSYNGWKFKVDDNTDDFSMVAVFKGPENKPKKIRITNTATNEIIIADSARQAARITNTDKRIIAYRLKNPYKYKNNTFIYELLSDAPL